jgi:hypothetical protein
MSLRRSAGSRKTPAAAGAVQRRRALAPLLWGVVAYLVLVYAIMRWGGGTHPSGGDWRFLAD